MFDVVITYTDGHIEILNKITEIHYNYRSSVSGSPKMIAFESDIELTGCVIPFSEILEFEAKNNA
jgi:hypothetical protein